MNSITRYAAGFFVSLAIGIGAPGSAYAQAGIPTFDAASLAKFVELIQTTMQQINVAKQNLAAISGIRGLGDIYNNPAIRAALPPDAQAVLRDLDGAMSELKNVTDMILAENHAAVADYAVERIKVAARLEELAARRKALNQQIMDSLSARTAQVDQLRMQINLTQDAKAIAELQARLAVELSDIEVQRQRGEAALRLIDSEIELLKHRAGRLYSGWFSASLKPDQQDQQ